MTEDEWDKKMSRLRELGQKKLGEITDEEWEEYRALIDALIEMLQKENE